MAQAAEQPTYSELDPAMAKFPSNGLTPNQLFALNPNFATPACKFDDPLWWSKNPDVLRKLQSSIGTEMLICDGISYCLPVVPRGKFFPVKVPFVTMSHGDIELKRRGSRQGLTPNFDNTISSSSSITWPPRPIWLDHPIFGKPMGLSPLWVQTPKGTKNRDDIHTRLSSFTYYVLVFVEDTDDRVDLEQPGLKWSPHVWNPDGCLIDRFREWCPHHNIKYEPRPSPSAMWDDVNQKWICPKPLTQLPGLDEGCILLRARPCGLQWRKNRTTGNCGSYVKYRTLGGVYLGVDRSMECESWKDYNKNHKGKTVWLQIPSSFHKRFSLNAFKEGYRWDEDIERWVWDFPDGCGLDDDC
jgi:hypothetical protein